MGLGISGRQLRNALSLLALISPLFSQQPKVLAPHDPIMPKAKKFLHLSSVPGAIAGGPWMVDANFRSVIYLKNIVDTSAITVTPILHLSNGTKYQLSPVQMEASGTAAVDVNASLQKLGIAPYATLSGWVELQYSWPWVPLCAMIRNLDATHSLIFTFGYETPATLSSQSSLAIQSAVPQVEEGLWWKHEANVTGFLALSNTAAQPIKTLVQVTDNHAKVLGTYNVTISAEGTKTLNLQELQTAPTNEGGIRVSYVGPSEALLINGGLEDPSVGYSANLRLSPLQYPMPPMSHATTQQGIAELGLMVGPADQMMRFPAGTTFAPYSVLRNVSTGPISVTPALWWMQAGTAASSQLPQFTMLPGETRSLNLASLLASAGLKNFTGSFNLVFDTQGNSGLLIAGGSVDQTNTYVFEVAARGIVKSAGKSISYWSTANGDDTMVTLWNPADESQNFVLRLMFAGGHYNFPVQLGPRATRMFNISDIIANQIPDADGNIIPAGIQDGSATIVGSQADNQHILVGVDSGVYNVRKATCGGSCQNCPGATSWSIQEDPFGVPVSSQNQESLIAQWCTGSQYDMTSSSTWSSSNTSIATVQTGLVRGVSAGSFVLSAADNTEPVCAPQCNPYGSCPAYEGGGGSSPGNVCQVTGIEDPALAMIGSNSVQITIDGSGFASPAVKLPNGFTSTGQSSQPNKIVVTADIGFGATIGNNTISVSVNGGNCGSANFTVNGPNQLVVWSDVIGQTTNDPNAQSRFVTYTVKNVDNTAAANIPIAENVSETGWNCNQSNPGNTTAMCNAKYHTDGGGNFTDQWGMYTGFTPAGCGVNITDHWQWCGPAGSNPPAPNPGITFGTPTGWIHTSDSQIDGYKNPPNAMKQGTVIP